MTPSLARVYPSRMIMGDCLPCKLYAIDQTQFIDGVQKLDTDGFDFYIELERLLWEYRDTGPIPYLRDFAQDRLNEFYYLLSDVSSDGYVFMKKVEKALKESMKDIVLKDPDISLKDLQTSAMSYHADIYIKNGFTRLPLTDRIKILVVAGESMGTETWHHFLRSFIRISRVRVQGILSFSGK